MSARHPVVPPNILKRNQVPALPRSASGPVSGARTTTNVPMNPSPLRASEVASGVEKMSLEDTPQASPVDDEDSNKTETAAVAKVITPPDSALVEEPLVVDESLAEGEIAAHAPFAMAQTPLRDVIVQKSPEDPFVSPAGEQAPKAAMIVSTPTQTAIERIQARLATPVTSGPSPRADRLGQPVTSANAQGLFPEEAALFIANLSNQRTDDQLEISVNEAFEIYGECHPKIRHDKNGQPFAFLQFEEIAAADEAYRLATGSIVDGRAVRVERARGSHEVIISKENSAPFTIAEARAVLEIYGPLRTMTATSILEDGSSYAFIAKFIYYMDTKDAVFGLRNNEFYELVYARRPDPNTTVQSGWIPRGPRYSADERSIYVGGLARDTTEEILMGIFAEHGSITMCNIIHKEIYGRVNSFAFIEFAAAASVDLAVAAEKKIGNLKLRVERKKPAEHKARVPAPTTPPMFAPQYINPTLPNVDQMHNVYRQAVQRGVAVQDAAHAINLLSGSHLIATPIPHYAQAAPQPFTPSPYHQGGFVNTPPHSQMHSQMQLESPTPQYYGGQQGSLSPFSYHMSPIAE